MATARPPATAPSRLRALNKGALSRPVKLGLAGRFLLWQDILWIRLPFGTHPYIFPKLRLRTFLYAHCHLEHQLYPTTYWPD